MLFIELIFWLSLFAIFYAYLGYPAVLWLITLVKPKKLGNSKSYLSEKPYSPTVTLLISAYNEEEIIDKKLKNCLNLDYPKDLMDIIVISDASTDNTDETVKEYSKQGVRLLRQEKRMGKTYALNTAIPESKGNIIIFSDANAMYDTDSIKSLVKHFQNPAIGFVTGKTKYISRHGSTVSESTSFYSKLEHLIKRLESRIGSCVGADGAIFAIRKKLYKPLEPHDINDFVIPLQIIRQGYRGIFEKDAFCIEETARDSEGEFNRQVRITNRTIRAIFNNATLLNPLKSPFFSFELISHKLIKFMLPFFMFTIFTSNCILIANNLLYFFPFILQISYYILVYKGYMNENGQKGSKLASMAYTFSMVSSAILVGWIKYFSGETYSIWNPERK